MKKIIALIALLCGAFCGCEKDRQDITYGLIGTWRQGFKEAYAKATTFKSWDALWDWAESETNCIVVPIKISRSTTLDGRRWNYIDTRKGGIKDACEMIIAEMLFIGSHNSGDSERFFEIMTSWLNRQDPNKIIPPGHF